MADWSSYMQSPDYRGLVQSNANAGAAVNAGMDTAFSQGLQRDQNARAWDQNARAWDENTRANNAEGRTQQLFPLLLDKENYAKAQRGMEMLGHWSDFANDVQSPEEWAHLKDAAKAAGVDTSKFDDDNWMVGRRKLQVMTGATRRMLAQEMQRADLELKRAEALKTNPYVGLDINTQVNKAAGILPPDAQSAAPRPQGGVVNPVPPFGTVPQPVPEATQQQTQAVPQTPVQMGQAAPQAPQPAPAPSQNAPAGQIPPGQAKIVGTPAPKDRHQLLREVIASLPPQEQAAANVAYAKALRTGDAGELLSILQKYQSPASVAAQEFGKDAGKKWSEQFNGHLAAAGTARQMEVTLGQFEDALSRSSDGLSSGATAEARAMVANIAQSMGINPAMVGVDRQNLSQLELMKSLGSQLTANMAKALQQGEGGGKSGPAARVTDADIRLFSASEPGIDKSPAGNRLLIAIIRQRNQLQYQLAAAAQQAQHENPNDPMAAQRAYHKYEEQAYAQYEQTRRALFDQAGFGPKEAGKGKPVHTDADVMMEAKRLGVSDDLAAKAVQAIRNGKDPQAVMQRLRELAGGGQTQGQMPQQVRPNGIPIGQ